VVCLVTGHGFKDPESLQRAAIEHIWSSGGRVVSVVPRSQTLEQLFVELMKDSSPRETLIK